MGSLCPPQTTRSLQLAFCGSSGVILSSPDNSVQSSYFLGQHWSHLDLLKCYWVWCIMATRSTTRGLTSCHSHPCYPCRLFRGQISSHRRSWDGVQEGVNCTVDWQNKNANPPINSGRYSNREEVMHPWDIILLYYMSAWWNHAPPVYVGIVSLRHWIRI